MTTARRRLVSLPLAVSWVLTGLVPVAATDPTPPPTPSGDDVSRTPTIHAEMLEEHADLVVDFEPGATPPAMGGAGASGGGGVGTVTTDEVGATTGLPNGLRKEVYGYLPYWSLSSAHLGKLNYHLVSSIAYFSVGANPDGTLAKYVNNEPTVGWAGWNSAAMTGVMTKAHQNGVKVSLTVTMMAWGGDYTNFKTLLNTTANRDRLATEIANAVKARNADGVNLDFEPMPDSLENAYTAFVRKVKSELVRVGAGSYLTVAVTGGAASWNEGYELTDSNGDGHTLTSAGGADALMVMAYDFNWSGSARAGGVAPIDSPYILDSRDAMKAFVSKVDPSKLIWGVPYYGRAWTTQTNQLYSLTCRSSSICPSANEDSKPFGRSWAPTYVNALSAVAQHGRRWDATGQVPWYTYWSSTYNTYVQAYYDDAQSLSAKYTLMKNNGLRGIGIWHLLMDGDRAELWNTLAAHFVEPPFSDVSSSPFLADIVWLADTGITNGCGGGKFCPANQVSRDQMASFLSRGLTLPAATRDYFTDDAGSVHEADINRVAESAITLGCGPTTYCPTAGVKRDQMASFLARALELPAATRDYFTDDAGSAHEADINRIAEAGISLGCGSGQYCPGALVTREQMAAFLHRALGS